MGLNFRKSLSIGKLFRINFSKKGIGVSAGVKGARVSLNKDGLRETFSLPGTGLSWSERQSFKKRKKSGAGSAVADAAGAETAETAGTAVAAGAARKKNAQWKSLIWVALVAGFFMLYKSGALDPMIKGVTGLFTGKPATGVTASVKAGASPSGETGVAVQTAEAAVVSASQTAQAGASGSVAGVAKCKDGTVTLKATTLFVASKSGEKFHKPDCSVVESIASANLVEYDSRESALAKKEPCSKCKP